MTINNIVGTNIAGITRTQPGQDKGIIIVGGNVSQGGAGLAPARLHNALSTPHQPTGSVQPGQEKGIIIVGGRLIR